MRAFAALAAVLLAACAGPEPAAPPAADAGAPAAAPSVAERPAPRARARRPGPIPLRPLEVSADCAFRDETGYQGALKLRVEAASVRAFEARVLIPRRGACRFDLRDFRQTRGMPGVELSQREGRCVVRMWEQGERVTVAFQQCERMCSGLAFDYLWPILADRRDGTCA